MTKNNDQSKPLPTSDEWDDTPIPELYRRQIATLRARLALLEAVAHAAKVVAWRWENDPEPDGAASVLMLTLSALNPPPSGEEKKRG